MKIVVSYSKIPYSLGYYCIKAFRKLGHEVIEQDYLAARHNYGLVGHAISKLVFREKGPNKELLQLVEQENPDIVFILKGEVFAPETLRKIKEKGVKLINWCMDSPFHPSYSSEKLQNSIGIYDHFFTPVKDMEKRLKGMGYDNAKFLAFACDPDTHKSVKLTEIEKEEFGSNVTFVGTYYPEREALLSGLEKFGLKIWGNEWNNCISDLKRSATMKTAEGEDMSRVFSASKIAIGTHQEQSMGSLTMRAFEVPAAGGFLLVDEREDLRKFFTKGEMDSYKDKKELLKKVEYYLKNEKKREQMAKRAQTKARKHTYVHRMRDVVKSIK
jgi:spore maturation protein CgeB